MANDGFNPDGCAVRRLSCRERMLLKERLIAWAHEERRRLMRLWAARIAEALRLALRRVNELRIAAIRRFIVRHRRMEALRQLAGMTDRELRDIGISRLEIGAAARLHTAWPRGDRSTSEIRSIQGENRAKGLLDRPRLCS